MEIKIRKSIIKIYSPDALKNFPNKIKDCRMSKKNGKIRNINEITRLLLQLTSAHWGGFSGRVIIFLQIPFNSLEKDSRV